jgi:nucleoside-diphosphate-sugar epimerase
MTTAFVTGATGFLGRHLVRELRGAGIEVRGLCRDPGAGADLAQQGVALVRGDLLEPATLAAGFEPAPDVVFHTAADTSAWTPGNPRQTRINVEGTRALVALAERTGAAFVHTSSISAFSHLVHDTLTEDTPQRGGESWINYERTKYEAEQIVRGAGLRGLRTIVCYPAHIFGPGDTHNWSRLIRLIDTGKLPGAPPGSGAFADVREVARAELAAFQGGRYGERYLLGGEHARFLDLIHRIGRLLRKRTPENATPAFLLKAYAHASDLASRVTRRAPEITPEAAAYTCHDLRVDSSKAIRELGYRETPLDTMLADTVAWMRSAGMLSAS